MKNSTKEAFAEVSIILSYMDLKDVEKIPQKIRELFEKEKDLNYKKVINPSIPLKEQNLNNETLSILAFLNYKYWCEDEHEKQSLLNQYMKNEEKLQKELREKYNPDDLFKSKPTRKKENQLTTQKELISTNQSWASKIFNSMKKLFSSETEKIKIDYDNVVEVYDKNGIKHELIVVLYFTLESNNKDYIAYLDKQSDNKNTIYLLEVIYNKNETTLNAEINSDTIEEIRHILQKIQFS